MATTSLPEPGPSAEPKPGWTTSEFWVTVATNVVALGVALATIFGQTIDPAPFTALVPAISVLAAAIAAGFYAHSRGVVKSAAAAVTGPSTTGVDPSVTTTEATAGTDHEQQHPTETTSSHSSNSAAITADSPLVWALVPWSVANGARAADGSNGHAYAGTTGALS